MHAIEHLFSGDLKRRAVLGLALAALLLPGCGKNRVVLDVDVRSFMNESELTQSYPDMPAGVGGELKLDPTRINLVEGYQDFGKAEEATIDISLRFDNMSGSGRATFTLYLSETDSTESTLLTAANQVDPYIEANLVPNTPTTSQVHIRADQRLLDLFTSKEMWMGVKISWQPLSSQEVLSGSYTITALDARVVSTLDLFN